MLCALGCWKMNLQPKHRFLAAWNRFSLRVCLFSALSTLLWCQKLFSRSCRITRHEEHDVSSTVLEGKKAHYLRVGSYLVCTSYKTLLFRPMSGTFIYLDNFQCSSCDFNKIFSQKAFLSTLPKRQIFRNAEYNNVLTVFLNFSERISLSFRVVAGLSVTSFSIALVALFCRTVWS